MEKEQEKIHGAEVEIMQVLWKAACPVPLAQLCAALEERCGWADSTTRTLLRRLQNRGAVVLVSRGVYAAGVTQEAYGKSSARRLVNKLFAGSARKLVASLMEDGSLSQEDLDGLYAMFHAEEKK